MGFDQPLCVGGRALSPKGSRMKNDSMGAQVDWETGKHDGHENLQAILLSSVIS